MLAATKAPTGTIPAMYMGILVGSMWTGGFLGTSGVLWVVRRVVFNCSPSAVCTCSALGLGESP